MSDLFASDARLVPVDMPDADVAYCRRLPMAQDDAAIFAQLRSEIDWEQRRITVWGKEHPQPRLTAWYGDPGRSYSYSGTLMEPLAWTPLLLELKRAAEKLTGAMFNSVLLNLYRDENDRMGFHSDDEASLGDEPVIASLSYGAPRVLIFKHRHRRDPGRRRVRLDPGSVLLMRGATQANWHHGIDRENKPCGPRINLTFRRIVV